MPSLIDTIACEVFVRFTRAHPMADLFVMGMRYREFALANPQRYQMTFGTSAESLNRFHADLMVTDSVSASSPPRGGCGASTTARFCSLTATMTSLFGR